MPSPIERPAWCMINVIAAAGCIAFVSSEWAAVTTRRTRKESIAALAAMAVEQGLNPSWRSLKSRGYRVMKCKVVIDLK